MGNRLSRRERRFGPRGDESFQERPTRGKFPDRLRSGRHRMQIADRVGNHCRQRRYHKIESARRDGLECGLSHVAAILKNNAADAALSLELDPWPPDCPMAQSLSAMAYRNLYRRQDDANRVPGILGIPVDGAHELMALPQVDGGNGSVCPSSRR